MSKVIMKNYTVIAAILMMVIGLIYYIRYGGGMIEGFGGMAARGCPTVLIQKDSKFYLFNTSKPEVPGVNPIVFDNLEDYTEFIAWQRSEGKHCPVLFVQQGYDAQGTQVFQARPDPMDVQGGLSAFNMEDVRLLVDAGHDDPPYNWNAYPSFDAHNQNIGVNTPLDVMNEVEEAKTVSGDPMHTNWGGVEYTKELVDSGYYAKEEVYKYSN